MENKSNKSKKNNFEPKILRAEGKLTCPICNKEFKASGDTKYIFSGAYTCSWKCFYNEVKKREEAKKEAKKKEVKEEDKDKVQKEAKNNKKRNI